MMVEEVLNHGSELLHTLYSRETPVVSSLSALSERLNVAEEARNGGPAGQP